MQNFTHLKLIDPLLKAIKDSGYEKPTPIQVQAIPPLLEGRDLLGCAQTGTGKTAAFALPLLQRLSETHRRLESWRPRVLVLTPTRELAIQIDESFRVYGKYLHIKTAVVFGGVGQQPQVKSLRAGVDVLVATPGRLVDLVEQKYVDLSHLEVFVLDEADRMLDMGFIHAIRKILTWIPKTRQTLFFSATMPADIEKLASTMLQNPVRIEVTPPATTVELIRQSVMYVNKSEKRDLLRHVLDDRTLKRVIVFTRTKHGANRVVEVLVKNKISSAAIHGNKSQGARQRALEDFRAGRVRVLVATDIAARGIDVDDVTHVINFEIPNVPESYVHRIGRTARAGAKGIAISFCDAEEKAFIRDIEKITRQNIPVDRQHPYHSREIENASHHGSAKASEGSQRTSRPSSRFGRRPAARSSSRPSHSRDSGAGRQGRSSGRNSRRD